MPQLERPGNMTAWKFIQCSSVLSPWSVSIFQNCQQYERALINQIQHNQLHNNLKSFRAANLYYNFSGRNKNQFQTTGCVKKQLTLQKTELHQFRLCCSYNFPRLETLTNIYYYLQEFVTVHLKIIQNWVIIARYIFILQSNKEGLETWHE